MIALKRPLYCPSDPRGPTLGKDVAIAKFGMGRYEDNLLPKPKGGYTQRFGKAMEEAVRIIQRMEHIPVTGNIGTQTWAILWPRLDAYRRWQYRNFQVPLTFEEKAWEKLLTAMQEMDAHTAGYQLGAGHGIPLSEFNIYGKSDCSSSTSAALYQAGLFEGMQYALVSGDFYKWGVSGVGTYFTVYYNAGHVFIRLHKSKWWRFDTSPRGEGGTGPRLRYLPRFTTSFQTRHYPKM